MLGNRGPVASGRAPGRRLSSEHGARTRILLIGPASGGGVVGGAGVAFAETVRHLRERGFALDVVSTARPRSRYTRAQALLREPFTFARVLLRTLAALRRADVAFLHMSPYGALAVASTLWLVCRVARKPLALRFFGGALFEVHRGYAPPRRLLAGRTFLRCPLVFVESRQLLRAFGEPANFRWLPNTRDVPPPDEDADEPRGAAGGKLAFIGQLRMAKGLGEALAACRSLPADWRLHVYGPPMRDTDWTLFAEHPRAVYGGVLDPAAVPAVLRECDALLLPTYYRGENYPGVVVEALQCGTPVIATRWRGIPELIEDGESGLLVEPRSVDELEAAIQRLIADPDLRRRLRAGAGRRGECFRGARWYDGVAGELRALARAR